MWHSMQPSHMSLWNRKVPPRSSSLPTRGSSGTHSWAETAAVVAVAMAEGAVWHSMQPSHMGSLESQSAAQVLFLAKPW